MERWEGRMGERGEGRKGERRGRDGGRERGGSLCWDYKIKLAHLPRPGLILAVHTAASLDPESAVTPSSDVGETGGRLSAPTTHIIQGVEVNA